ncbi:hypothetical protein [Manganibacter manganicus]|uniref:RNA polymerase alpha subunit C-terminal domain-containing protein n=1 Tax=Manganibacter manganicus TaxID=1873176 RepID=A0A1V8RU22_9HYPH|nr:hypothetical protein [Pseudaminobacter manganicus]OQM76701.1 hypothetical protein BFN67_12360 [Pseudaminobacter manganicus]
MNPDTEFTNLPDNDPDLLENSGLSKLFVERLRRDNFTRLTQTDGMSDRELLRLPAFSRRLLKAVRQARARLALPEDDR